MNGRPSKMSLESKMPERIASGARLCPQDQSQRVSLREFQEFQRPTPFDALRLVFQTQPRSAKAP